MASRSARAFASLSETAADLPHRERLPAIEAAPMLCRSVLVSPSRFSSSAIFMLSPLFVCFQYRVGARRRTTRADRSSDRPDIPACSPTKRAAAVDMRDLTEAQPCARNLAQ